MDDLVKEFIEETIEGLSELDTDLVMLEKDPDNKDLLDKIFRLMHTIKGTCGFLALPRLEKSAHAAENLLDLFRSGGMDVTEEAMTILFLCLDRVRYLTFELRENNVEPQGDDQDIIDQIEGIILLNEQEKNNENNSVENTDVVAGIENEAQEKIEQKPEQDEKEDKIDQKISKLNTTVVTDKPPEFLKVQMSVLENLINMVSELVLTRNQILQLVSADEDSELAPTLQSLNRIVSDLQEGVMKTRMQPISNAWTKLPRIVRDLSTELGKKIDLQMFGEETELDRQVLEMIKDPLTHMIRNACDHGIEMPEDRVATGKVETGIVTLRAYHEGGFVILELHDDGKGLDAQKIGQKAIEKGLLDESRLDQLSDKQILQNIFKPGFSTAQQVTNVSGRGVGMDVVRTNIEKIGGTIDMDSTLGKGMSFKIQIPLTLAIISALIVEIDGARYALPQLNIQELVRIHSSDKEKIEMINDRPVFRLREKILPLIDKNSLFQTKKNSDGVKQETDDDNQIIDIENKLIAVVSAGSNNFGLIVDSIHDMEEIVIKSISSVLQDTKIFAGNTILGDGDVIMILDPASIARHFDVETDLRNIDAQNNSENVKSGFMNNEKAAMLIFKAGSGTPMALPLALISRLQQIDAKDVSESGDEIIAKHNGGLLPLYFLNPDGQKLERDLITTLVLSDDVSDAAIGLIIENVIDIVEDRLDLSPSTARPGVIGSVTLNGIIVDVVDIAHYLGRTKEDFFSLAQHRSQPFVGTGENSGVGGNKNSGDETSFGNRVLVVDDSPFFRNMLKPILVTAGYDVVACEDPIEAIELHDRGYQFDVILSDIEMPNMNGYEFIEKIRADLSWKNLPCIAITSHTTSEDIEYGYEKGFTKYIGKFDKDELIRTMGQVMDHKGIAA